MKWAVQMKLDFFFMKMISFLLQLFEQAFIITLLMHEYAPKKKKKKTMTKAHELNCFVGFFVLQKSYFDI